MALANFTELKEAIAGWLNRDDLEDRTPDFIRLAEDKINRLLRVHQQLTVIPYLLDSEYRILPVDWLQTADLSYAAYESGGEIEFLTHSKFIEERRNHSPSGRPCYYTLEGNRKRFLPVPAEPQDALLNYYARVPALTEAAPTNWLLEVNADLYLAACLMAANTYLRDMEGIALATAEFKDILATMQSVNESNKTSTTPVMRARSL